MARTIHYLLCLAKRARRNFTLLVYIVGLVRAIILHVLCAETFFKQPLGPAWTGTQSTAWLSLEQWRYVKDTIQYFLFLDSGEWSTYECIYGPIKLS